MTQTHQEAVERIRKGTDRFINDLSHADRIAIRNMMDENEPQPRNLYYDYDRQEWIS